MTPSPVLCFGEILWDFFPDLERLGGCAANVAYHLAQLGDDAMLVSRVGNDELGRRALAELERAGVDTHLVEVDESARTGTVNVCIENGEPRFTIATDAAWDRIAWTAALEHAARGASAVVFGTLAQRTPTNGVVLDRLCRALPPSSPRLCDLNLRPPFTDAAIVDSVPGRPPSLRPATRFARFEREQFLRTLSVLAHATIAKLNESEAARLEQIAGVPDAVEWLLTERGVELVALTRGARGAMLRTAKQTHEHSGEPARTGDTVGAGDAFAAVLVHHTVRGSTLARANAAANRHAGFVASREGAMPPIPADVARMARATSADE